MTACQTAQKLVVAFNRDRDFYQVPLALHEEGLLAELVTDFYLPNLGPLFAVPGFKRFRHRRVAGLPRRRTHWHLPALLSQLGMAPDAEKRLRRFKALDQGLSRAALARAIALDAGLFLYSGYALEAFADPQAISRLKGLFVYHPHGALSRDILEQDFAEHPEVAWSHRLHLREIESADRDRLDQEAALAQFIVCASSFTAASLRHAGVPARRIAIAPYGCFTPTQSTDAPPKPRCSFLFVGQGVQRKGLHHLLKVWRRLRLPQADLTVVASYLDPEIARLAASAGVTLLGAQSRAALKNLFSTADVFVMPSLIEGFGLVYLEALAAGCFTIGSGNSGMPDLSVPDWAGRTVDPGNLDQLALTLRTAHELHGARQLDRAAIRHFAATLTWARFRRMVAERCRQAGQEATALSSPSLPTSSFLIHE